MVSENTNMIEKLELKDEVLKLYKKGLSYNNISKELAKKDISISSQSISRWVGKQAVAFRENSSNSLKNLERFEGVVIKYDNEIKSILEEVKEMKDIAKEQGKLDTYAKLVDRLYRGLELLGKFMGDIKPDGAVDIKIIVNEINKGVYEDNKGAKRKVFTSEDNKIFDAKFVEKEK